MSLASSATGPRTATNSESRCLLVFADRIPRDTVLNVEVAGRPFTRRPTPTMRYRVLDVVPEMIIVVPDLMNSTRASKEH